MKGALGGRVVCFLAALAAAGLFTGCAQTEPPPERRTPDRPIVVRPAPTQHLIARGIVRGLGVVPYDMASLPLVSPDGRFLATQFGSAPDSAARDAAPGAAVPHGTRIAIHRLEVRNDFDQELPLLAVLEEPMLLGRSCSAEGFLVEAPRENGARWIGFVGWESREVEWIVADDMVNAFAALGPDNRLAWSRRPVDGDRFELVVQIMDSQFTIGGESEPSPSGRGQGEGATGSSLGDESTLTPNPSPPGRGESPRTDWLAPTWSERGDGLFVATLVEGALGLSYLQGRDRVSMLQSQQSIRLALDAGVGHALDMLSGQPATVGDPQPDSPLLLFAHPAARYRGMALWRPLRSGGGATQILDQKAYAATIDEDSFVIVAVRGSIDGFPLDSPDTRITFASEDGVPRTTTSEEWPILLLIPMREQPRLRVVGLQAVAVR